MIVRAVGVATLLAGAALAQQPEMAHLAYTGKDGELSLDFMAHFAALGCNATWGVQIGTSPDLTAADFVPAYACTDATDQEPAPTFAVRVLLSNLTVGQTYYYVCGSFDTPSYAPWSQIFSFTYRSGYAREGGPIYAVLADFGYYNAESLGQLMKQAFEGDFDAVLHAGDFAYDLDANGGAIGDGFMRQIQPIVAQMPYNGIPGNHEVDGMNFTSYRTRFASIGENAGATSGSHSPMYYSFDEGNVHFLMWDSEIFWTRPVAEQQAMVSWLQADLARANANRKAVPWIISLAHKTWYMDNTLDCPNGAGCVVWDLLTRGGVDLYLTGHIHLYSRLAPQYPNAYNGSGAVDLACIGPNRGNSSNWQQTYTNPKFITTIISAAPGDQEVNAQLQRHTHSAVGDAQPVVQTMSLNYGFGLLQILNDTHLHWTFNTAVPHVNSTAPNYSDDFWLIVDSHGPRSNLPPV